MNETRILMPIPTADRNEALVQRYNSLHENLENNHYTDVHQFLTMNLNWMNIYLLYIVFLKPYGVFKA